MNFADLSCFTFLFNHYLVRNYSFYQFTPPFILLGLKKIDLLSVDEISHAHLNAGKALGERIINTHHL